MIDASEFVDLLRLCGYGELAEEKLTENLASQIIQKMTESEFTTEMSSNLFTSQMKNGNMGKIVHKMLKLDKHRVEKKTSLFGGGDKKKRRASAMLEDSEHLLIWNSKRKLFNDSFSMPAQVLMLLHAPISRMAFQYFDCPEVGGKTYLRADYEIECFTSGWKPRASNVAPSC